MLRLWVALVEYEETGLATALDELVWLCDELRAVNPLRELRVGGDGVRRLVPGNPRNLWLRVHEGRAKIYFGLATVEGGRPREPVCYEELRIVLTNGYMRIVSGLYVERCIKKSEY